MPRLHRMIPLRRFWASLGRLGLAVVLVLGMLASAGGKTTEAEAELTVELEEEAEPFAGVRVRAARRAPSMGGQPLTRGLGSRRAPPRLDHAAPEPPLSGWWRPRRVPPDDDQPIA